MHIFTQYFLHSVAFVKNSPGLKTEFEYACPKLESTGILQLRNVDDNFYTFIIIVSRLISVN